MKRFDARKAVLQALKDKGLYRETKDNPMVVPVCSRSKDIVEPLIKAQWYVKCDEMAARAVKSVKSGELTIIPDHHLKTWYYWMENIRDWCISRQLWWGHRIPAYFVTLLTAGQGGDRSDGKYWVSGRSEGEARVKAAERFGVGEDEVMLEQDEDVLDTWFSSALFPFSIFGWPDHTPDLKLFYPGTLLETGHDILFFWVARMVMMGQKLMGALPFNTVYLHAMVRDAHGRKMSKSLGNVINPLDVVHGISLEDLHKQLEEGNLDPKEVEKAKRGQREDFPQGIPECGVDALRFALCAYTSQGRDINLDVSRIQGYRFFCNKMWNATRFALNQLGEGFKPDSQFKVTSDDDVVGRWMLSRLAACVTQCDESWKSFDFPAITTSCYNLWLYELCDVYLEYIKTIFSTSTNHVLVECSKQTLYLTLYTSLHLISPLMPFITEELYQRLPGREGMGGAESICVSSYPQPQQFSTMRDERLDSKMQFIQGIIRNIRSLRNDYNLAKTKADVYVLCADADTKAVVNPFTPLIATLGQASQIIVVTKSDDAEIPVGCAIQTVSDKCAVHLLLKGIIDVDKEMSKLTETKLKLEVQIEKLVEVTQVEGYQQKVPQMVRDNNREKMDKMSGEVERLAEALKTLSTFSS